MQASSKPPILIDDGLDVFGVNIRAHHTDRGVTAPEDPEEGKTYRMHPGQWPSRPVGQWIVAEGGRVESKRAERCHHATVVEEASLIVDVVSDPWRQHVQPADGANDLAFRVDLEVMDEGVVLKYHRQARIVAKQCTAQLGPGPRESPYGDTGR